MVDYKPIVFGIAVTLIVGSVSIFTPFLGFFVQIILGTLAIITGGIAAAYTTDGDNKDGGVNGALSGIFGGSLVGVLLLLPILDSVFNTFAGISMGILCGGILFGMNFGIIGAVIGNIIKRDSQATSKENGYLVCDNCGGYYELQEGESPEKFDLSCDCGGKIQYRRSLKSDVKFSFDRVFGIGVLLTIISGILLICTIGTDLDRWIRRIILYSFASGLIIIISYCLKSRGVNW